MSSVRPEVGNVSPGGASHSVVSAVLPSRAPGGQGPPYLCTSMAAAGFGMGGGRPRAAGTGPGGIEEVVNAAVPGHHLSRLSFQLVFPEAAMADAIQRYPARARCQP